MSDDDYMSDKFLDGIAEVRPSLIHSRAKKRQIEVEFKKVETIKKQREVHSKDNRNERLQESLSRPIEADNKGFKMLAKMGYKPGSALGKQNSSESIKEPISVCLKFDRSGFGRDAALRELAEKRAQLHREQLLRRAGIDKAEAISTEAYRQRATQKAEERKLQHDLRRCQQTCETLDREEQLEEPELDFFWAERLKTVDEDEEDDEDEPKKEEDMIADDEVMSNADKLELLTGYLRTAYQFCYWCGTRYENVQDMEENCPGKTRDEH